MKENLIKSLMKFITRCGKKIIFLIVCCLFFVNLVFPQEANITPIVTCKDARECNWQAFVESLGRLIRTTVILSFFIAMLMATIGAFLIMLHGPSETLYKRGVDMIKIAIWGYILILLSAIIFDIILDFFQPKFREVYLINFVFAADSKVTSWYNFMKENVMSSLRCGQGATKPLDRLFRCIFEAIGLLKNIAVVFLALAIIVSAAYIITVPLFGLGNFPKAYNVLIWSIIGLVIVLLADLIKSQIERLVR